MLDPYQKLDFFGVNPRLVSTRIGQGFNLRHVADMQFAVLSETTFGVERTKRDFLLTI
jgi:hypothetical protein